MITLRVTVSEQDKHTGERRSLRRTVNWPSVPDVSEIVFVGINEDGEPESIDACVVARYFGTHEILVSTEIFYCRENYRSVVDSLLRDGFQ